MKTEKALFFTIPFLLFLLTVSSCPAYASENDETYYCSTAEELYETLTLHPGGTIFLTDTIEWNFSVNTITVPAATVIQMGEYGICVQENGYLEMDGPVSFYGSGSRMPLFLVEGYLSTSPETTITASGEGCTAVQITGKGKWDSDLTTVTACGENAITVIYDDGPDTVLSLAQITSQGTGAQSLYTERPLEAVLCSITSEGGSAASGTSPITMTGCRVTPQSPEYLIYDCNVSLYDRILENYGFSYPIGTAGGAINRSSLAYYFTSDNDLEFTYDIPVSFDGVADLYTEAGEYSLTSTPIVPDWFPVSLPPLELSIHIIAPDQPYLTAAYELMDSIGIQFFSEITDAHSLSLYYSDDNGKTWQDIMELPGSYTYSLGAQIIGLPQDKDYLFYLDVQGGSMEGVSNILRFSYGRIDIDGGGDNDGGDRTDQDLPPYEQDPPDSGPEPGTNTPDPENGSHLPENPSTEANTIPPKNSASDAEKLSPEGSDPGAGTTAPESSDPDAGTRSPEDSDPDTGIRSPETSGPGAGTRSPETSASGAGLTAPGNTSSGAEKDSPKDNGSDQETATSDQTSEPLLEQVSETSTTISGIRLRLLLQTNPDTVLFEKDGITVEIPSAFLASLDLPDDAFLKISIRRTDPTSFSLSVNVDGRELHELEETTITMPFSPSGDWKEKQLTLIHTDTGNKNAVQYMSVQGRVSSNIYETGTYTLQEPNGQLPGRLTKQETVCILLLLTAVILCTAAAAVLLLRKRRLYHEKF